MKTLQRALPFTVARVSFVDTLSAAVVGGYLRGALGCEGVLGSTLYTPQHVLPSLSLTASWPSRTRVCHVTLLTCSRGLAVSSLLGV